MSRVDDAAEMAADGDGCSSVDVAEMSAHGDGCCKVDDVARMTAEGEGFWINVVSNAD